MRIDEAQAPSMHSHSPQESVAIIGMAGRFPQAGNLEEFWRNLRAGRECVSFFRAEEVQWLPLEHPPRLEDPQFVKARAVLEKPEWFDAAFFGMNPREAEIMDPQHRVFLECAWESLENAGCNPDTFDGLIGVFAGASLNTYLFSNLLTNPDLVKDYGLFASLIMNDGDFVPTRASYKFNLRGPSINVQTACSTSLVAVAMAAQNLLGYRCDVALAGGVSITFPASRGHHHHAGGIVSADGHCRAFDAKADGTVRGDGAGVVVLKRLSDALADRDNILAVIKGSAINNDGSVKIGYTAPSADGQAEVIALAQMEAGVSGESISYVEAHGTGTPLGDPIEVEGLTKAFGSKGRQFCALGSVKSNLGHLDVAAGVAGLIKTVLALQHGEIPPTVHFERPNPKIDFERSPFFVNAAARAWPKTTAPRRAGVSSFGIGGTNAHVVLEEAPAVASTRSARPQQLLVVSAKSEAALQTASENLAHCLEEMTTADGAPAMDLADVAYTLQTGRKVFACRRAVVASDVAAAVQALRAVHGKSERGPRDAGTPRVAFMFPGQGAQAVNMARGLYAVESDFRLQVDRCSEWLRPRLGLDLRDVLFPGSWSESGVSTGKRLSETEAENLLRETRITQPALFVIEYALAQMWIGWGVKPAAMIGHSLGEYVAACVAGVMSLEDALALVAERARLMQAQPAGAMTALRLAEEQVVPLLADKTLALAAVNAPGLCVVSGPFDAVEALEQRLAASAIPFKRLATSHAFHSSQMDGVQAPLAAIIRGLKLNPPTIPWVSNVTGTWITIEEAISADYWTKHLRQTVRFSAGIAALVATGHTVLLEVGPGSTLAGLARQNPAAATSATIAATLGSSRDGLDFAAVLKAVGDLWVAGIVPEWRDGFYRDETRRIVALPTYPFERKRFWIEPGAGFMGLMPESAHPGAVAARSSGTAESVTANASEFSALLGTAAIAPDSKVNAAATLDRLLALFAKLSGIPLNRANANDSFFELGFESLFLMQAVRSIGQEFGVTLSFRQLREDLVTFSLLAAYLDQKMVGAGPRPRPEPATTSGAVELPAAIRLPVTDAQREMWYASQLGEAVASAYHEQSTLRFNGPVNVPALREALKRLVARHEALRTTFSVEGDVQIVAPLGDLPLDIRDFAAVAEGSRDMQVGAAAREEVERAFDLAAGPLMRATLLRIENDQHLLVLVIHHIICDGWSLGTLVAELADLYSAETQGKPVALRAAGSFTNYAREQMDAQKSPAFAAARAFWAEQFSDSIPLLELPTDRVRPTQRTYQGGFVVRTLSPDLTAALREFCGERHCTLFTALLAAFNVLLHRLSRQDDLVVGVPSAGQVLGGLEHVVGHFANLLPVRSRVGGDETFSGYLKAVGEQLNQVLEHWHYPFSALVQQLKVARDSSRMPVANVVFNSSQLRGVPHFAGLQVEALMTPKRHVNFDLNFNFAVQADALVMGCYYSAELYDEATIQRWIGHLETLLEAIVAAPETKITQLVLLTAAERNRLLVEWNATALEYRRDATIHQLFEEQVKRTPTAVALVAEAERISYRELDRRAEQLAVRLRAVGVGADVCVGLMLERSPDLLVAILGILKAQGAYVPIDPEYPAVRIEFIVRDTGMPVIVSQRRLADQIPTGSATVVLVDNPAEPVAAKSGAPGVRRADTAGNLAYVLYTSGSTGEPKGVGIEHRAVVALAAWASQFYRADELNGVLFATAATFDVSVFESLIPLLLGGKIILAENILALGTLPAASEVKLVSGVPSAVAQLVRSKSLPASVVTVNVAGEACPQSLVDALYARVHVKRVIDVYGPTETTVYSAGGMRVANGAPTIGRPLPNERIYILDDLLQPVPVGVSGELYIAGDKLARGYLNRPELTRERFVEAPFAPGERMYRSGDRARFNPDGTIQFLGRLDHQVKVRGFRIELGEVEAAMRGCPGILDAVVVDRPDPAGGRKLVGYVVGPANESDRQLLRERLGDGLPAYMVPAHLVVVLAIPRLSSGKVDRHALPEPEVEKTSRVAPRTTTEEVLAAVWSEILEVREVGIHENFFELGGHSLLAAQVLVRVQEFFGVPLGLRQFFLSPTIAGIAVAIEHALITEIQAERTDVTESADVEALSAKDGT